MTKFLRSAALLLGFALGGSVQGLDWPQWGGPDRDHASKEKGLLQNWPEGGPKQVWVNKDAGLGYAGIAVVNGNLYTMGAREGMEFLIALDVKDGNEIWSAQVGPVFTESRGDGPRTTPTIVGDRIYTMGARGIVFAANITDGKALWTKRMVQDLGGKVPVWGYTESILVKDGTLYCTPGGSQGAVVALDAATGNVKWRTDDFRIGDPHYSSPRFATINGTEQLIKLTERALVSIHPANGKIIWKSDWRGETAVIPDPVVKDNYVYITSGYNVGCKLVKVGPQNKPEDVYQNAVMINHHGGVVLVGNHIYGYSERLGWVCQDFLTGQQVWAGRELGKGAVTYADNRLYCISEGEGMVVLAEASPNGWKEHGRFKLEPQTQQRAARGRIWTHPVVANGKLYLRDQELLSAYDISASRQVAAR